MNSTLNGQNVSKYQEKKKRYMVYSKLSYGLKQAPRLWHPHFHGFHLLIGFRNTYTDPSPYTMKDKNSYNYRSICRWPAFERKLYKNSWNRAQADIRARYKVRVGSIQSKFLEIVIEDVENGIFGHNCSAVQKLIFHFSMEQCKPCDGPLPACFGSLHHTSPPHSDVNSNQKIIGCLMYISNTTKPDIFYAKNYLSRFLQ